MKNTPKTLVLMYVLLGYVVLQFVWWAYLLYDLNVELIESHNALSVLTLNETSDSNESITRQLMMILGEGTVFLSLLLIGAYYIRKFLVREHNLAKQERNFLLATTHEFNSPIAAIKLNLQTIAKRELNPDQKSMVVSGALSAADRLESLASNILTASRIDAGKLEPIFESFSLSELMLKIQSTHKLTALKAGCNLKTSCPEDLIINSDKKLLELILENLISNAVKYAPGTEVNFSALNTLKGIEIKVCDLGPGISNNEKKSIFKKFYRIENEETRSNKGTGLGLYLVMELTKKIGGTIVVSDSKPHGTCFVIHINRK